MELIELSKIIYSEKQAYRYFKKLRWKKGFCCPFCQHKKVYNLADSRYECMACRCRFSDFSGTYLASNKLPYNKLAVLIKLFCLGVSARQAAKETLVNYKTALSNFELFRQTIVDHNGGRKPQLTGEVEMDESYFGGKRKGRRGRGAANKTPVFGMLERNGQVRIEIVSDVSSNTLLAIVKDHISPGSKTYTDKFRSYHSLIVKGYDHFRIDHSERFANGKTHINGIEGFWSYAKERLAKYHGISPNKFFLYMKELEFRFNNRYNNNVYEIICSYLTSLLRFPG